MNTWLRPLGLFLTPILIALVVLLSGYAIGLSAPEEPLVGSRAIGRTGQTEDGGQPFSTSTASVMLSSGTVLTATKAVNAAIAAPGDILTYTITLTNSGDTATTGVRLVDIVPANVTYITNSVSASTGTATYQDGDVYVTDRDLNRVQRFNSTGGFIAKWGSLGGDNGQFGDSSPIGVAVDGNGDVYVADYGNSRIQKFSSTGSFITSWGTYGSGDGQFNNPMGIAADSNGNVYVTDFTLHRVQKFDSSGNFVAKWGTRGAGNGQLNFPYGITLDSSGNVYVADYGNHRIQKFGPAGSFIMKWGSYGTGDGQFTGAFGVAVDGSHNVYVVDANNDRIQKFDAAGNFITKWGSTGYGDGQLSWPNGIAVDSVGDVYVTDGGNNRVQKFDSAGNFITKWASYGTGDGLFSWPALVAVGGRAIVWNGDVGVGSPVTITFQARVNSEAAEGTVISNTAQIDDGRNPPFSTTVARTTVNDRASLTATKSVNAATAMPGDVLTYTIIIANSGNANATGVRLTDTLPPYVSYVDNSASVSAGNMSFDGDVYVADYSNSRIQKFDTDGTFITKWGSYGSGNGQFSWPFRVAVDDNHNVYVVDDGNNRLQKFDATGSFITKWGSQGSSDGQFNWPLGAAVDGDGNVYVVDAGNNRVQKFGPTGSFITKWGSQGNGDGQFNWPHGAALDGDGNVYIADFGNHRVQKFSSTGTFLGKWGSYGSADGQFSGPYGVGADGTGSIYVADYYNNRVQKFDSSGSFLAKWGGYGSADGQFRWPSDVAVDANGNVYVADEDNNRVQKFSSAGSFIARWSNQGSGDGQLDGPTGIALGSPHNLIWSGAVSVGMPITITFRARVNALLDPGTIIGNVATLADGTGITFATNAVSTTVTGAPDLSSATKTASTATTRPGDIITYTIVLTNTGTENATSARITDALPSEVTYAGSSATSGSVTYTDGAVRWNGPVTVGTNVAIVVTATVGSPLTNGTVISNAAQIDDGRDPPFWTPPASTTVTSAPDLSTSTKTARTFVGPGGMLTYTIVLTNTGTENAMSARVTDTLPSALTYVGSSVSSGSIAYTAGAIRWNGPVTVATPVRIVITATVSAQLANGTVISNTAQIDDGHNPPFSTTPAATTFGLSILNGTMSASAGSATPGNLLTYTIVITNLGNVDAIGAKLTSTIPAQSAYIPGSASASTGSPNFQGNIYVLDQTNRIQKFDPNISFLGTWGSGGAGDGRFNSPYGVAVDSSGNVYVADSGFDRIQKFDANGSFVSRWNTSSSGSDQSSFPEGVAVDASGNVFVADYGNNRIQKFDLNGNFVAKWGGYGSGDGQFNWPNGIAVDSSGNVYVADTFNNRIQKFDPNGTFIAKWGSYGTADGRFNQPYDVAVDGNGNVYVADTINQRIQKLDANGVFIAQWGSPGFGDGQFRGPEGVAVDASGNVFVADYGNNRIQKFDPNGTFLAKWGSSGSGDGQFTGAQGVAVDASGNVYVVDYGNDRIQKFDTNGAFLTKWGRDGYGKGEFDRPSGVAVDGNGNVYVADPYNERIQKFDTNGNFIAKWGSSDYTSGEFDGPSGVAVDGSGNVYVADTGNDRIQKLDPNGIFLAKWGSYGSGDGQFVDARGVAVDGSGNVYIADPLNNRIQKFDPSGAFLAKWDSYGTGNGQFRGPEGVAVDGIGNVYVADTLNNRIQKLDPSGAFLAKWGGYGTDNGQFRLPKGVAVDGGGNVYVADNNNNRVQKFDPDGNFITKRASQGTGDGQFNRPHSVAVDHVSGVVTWNGRVDAGGTVTITFRARVRSPLDHGTPITNVATIDDGAGVTLPTNTVSTTVTSAPDLSSSTMAGTTGTVGPGGTVTYTIVLTNSGSENAVSARVTDSLPSQVSYVSSSASSGTPAHSGGVLTWNGPVTVGTPVRIIITATVSTQLANGTVFSNTAQIDDGQQPPFQTSPVGTRFGFPALTATEAANAASAMPGDILTYTIIITNAGYMDATGARLTTTIPVHAAYVPGSASASTGSAGFHGNIYVADTFNDRIQKFDANGNFITAWGVSGRGDAEFSYPEGVAVDGNGNVYVLDGANGRIQKFDADGSFIAKWNSSGSDDGQFSSPSGVAVDGSRNVYVVDTGNDRIQKFDPNGGFLAKWGSFGSGEGEFNGAQGVAVDGNGNVYVADTGNNRIQKFDPNGAFLAKWGSYGSGDGQFDRAQGVAVGGDGNVYVADKYNNRIQKFDANGSFITKWGIPDTFYRTFNWPHGVALDGDGSVYVADTYNNRIQKFDPNGNFLARWGSFGTGNGQFDTPNGVAVDNLRGIVTWNGSIGAGGTVTITFRARVISPLDHGTVVTNAATIDDGAGVTLATNTVSTTVTSAPDLSSSTKTASAFVTPGGTLTYTIALINSGTENAASARVTDSLPSQVTYVSSSASSGTPAYSGGVLTWNGLVAVGAPVRIIITTTVSTQLAVGTVFSNTARIDDGQHPPFQTSPVGTRFGFPALSATEAVNAASAMPGDILTYTITINNSGSLDATGARLTTTIPAHAAYVPGSAQVTAGSARFQGNVYVADTYNNRVQEFDANGSFIPSWSGLAIGVGEVLAPQSVAVAADGNVYVADTANKRIKKFDSNGISIAQWGSSGAGDGQFAFPGGVAVDSSGNVYVADAGNNRIQKFDANGNFITKWGSTGGGDGRFNWPNDVVIDGNGNIYVADAGNNRIQKFDANGNFITKWGSPGTFDGQFDAPSDVAVDGDGNIYVADTGNNRIQKFDANGSFITKWGRRGSQNGQFSFLNGIAADVSGNVYVADRDSDRIQKFDRNGNFVAKWGSTGYGNGQFDQPAGMAVDNLRGIITWNGTVSVGVPVTITFRARVSSPLDHGTVVTNAATVNDGAGVTLSTNTVSATVTSAPDLSSSTMTVSSSIVSPGGTLTYTIVLTNTGTENAASARITDSLPSQVTYISSSASRGTTSYSGGVLRWNGPVTVGTPTLITMTVTANLSAAGGSVIANSVSIDNGRRTTTSKSADVTVIGPNISTSSKSARPTVVAPGDTVTYTIRLVNTGNYNASASLTDPLPSQLNYVNGSASATSGIATYNSGAIRWTGDVTVVSPVTITFRATAKVGLRDDTVVNTANVEVPGFASTSKSATIFVLPPPVTTTISPSAGGAVTSTGHTSTAVTFPPGAVTQTLTMTLTPTTTTNIPGEFRALGNSFVIEATDARDNAVTQFSKPFTITVRYNKTDVAGILEASLKIYFFNVSNGRWEALPTTVDTVNNIMMARVNHLTLFTVMGTQVYTVRLLPIYNNYTHTTNGALSVPTPRLESPFDRLLALARWTLPDVTGWRFPSLR
ncbi:MAG: DUF11 domain-containing protein [Chloroflexi bacterium]|nr:DUF11 domain-containing protein [Chloroflexota bacterium]